MAAMLTGLMLLWGCQERPSAPSPESAALEIRMRALEARLAAVEPSNGEQPPTRSRVAELDQALRELRGELEAQRTTLEPMRRELTALRKRQASPAGYQTVDLALGELPSSARALEQRPIPTAIPAAAREILVYAQVATGYVRGGAHRFRIATRMKNGEEAAFYLYAIGQSQQSWAYNSENVWLPMPEDRMLLLQTDGQEPLFGDWRSELRIIGYR